MKKLILISILFLIFMLVGCKVNHNKIMASYVKDYYNNILKDQKVEGLDILSISLKDLKNSNASSKTNYDLEKLETCKDSSYIEIILKKDSKEIEKLNYYLKC